MVDRDHVRIVLSRRDKIAALLGNQRVPLSAVTGVAVVTDPFDLPADVNYDVTAELSAGEIDVLGETQDGFDNEVSARVDGSSAATVIVDLEADVGYSRVFQG